MYSVAILATTLLGAATALPTLSGFPHGSQPKPAGKSFDADFDDLTAVPAVAISPVGAYRDLYFQGMLVTELGVADAIVAGLYPHSPSNVAAYGLYAQVLEGTPALLTHYTDSQTASFDFRSFYFGCVLMTAGSAASTPQSCSITVTGFQGEDNAVATQEVDFVATGVTQQMQEVVLNKAFKGLTKVTFHTDAVLGGAAVATLLDNVDYVAYEK